MALPHHVSNRRLRPHTLWQRNIFLYKKCVVSLHILRREYLESVDFWNASSGGSSGRTQSLSTQGAGHAGSARTPSCQDLGPGRESGGQQSPPPVGSTVMPSGSVLAGRFWQLRDQIPETSTLNLVSPRCFSHCF